MASTKPPLLIPLKGDPTCWLLNEERETLVHPITPEEVLTTIQSFPTDGLPIEFYKTHIELLIPILASMYTNCLVSNPPLCATCI